MRCTCVMQVSLYNDRHIYYSGLYLVWEILHLSISRSWGSQHMAYYVVFIQISEIAKIIISKSNINYLVYKCRLKSIAYISTLAEKNDADVKPQMFSFKKNQLTEFFLFLLSTVIQPTYYDIRRIITLFSVYGESITKPIIYTVDFSRIQSSIVLMEMNYNQSNIQYNSFSQNIHRFSGGSRILRQERGRHFFLTGGHNFLGSLTEPSPGTLSMQLLSNSDHNSGGGGGGRADRTDSNESTTDNF